MNKRYRISEILGKISEDQKERAEKRKDCKQALSKNGKPMAENVFSAKINSRNDQSQDFKGGELKVLAKVLGVTVDSLFE